MCVVLLQCRRPSIADNGDYSQLEEKAMSVSGISNTHASDQINAVALSNALRNAQTQKLGQDFAPGNLDASDVATFQQSNGSTSTGSVSGNLTAVQRAYESLQQVATETNSDPKQASGSPVRRTLMGPSTINSHDPMPPVSQPPVGLPNPIKGHDPMPPVFGSPVGLPLPVKGHDPMPPVFGGAVSVIA